MRREFTNAEINEHNALTKKGWSLVSNHLVLHGVTYRRPRWFSRWQLRRAISCFQNALAIHPEGWSSMWALGKIYQCLGDQSSAFTWFAKAHVTQPDQPDVAREASIAALDTGRINEALVLCRAALALKPGDPGLACNLALAHCLAGHDEEAEKCAEDAFRSDPADEVSENVLRFVRAVAAGIKERPKNLCEVFPYADEHPPTR